jgi:hypothetical protein
MHFILEASMLPVNSFQNPGLCYSPLQWTLTVTVVQINRDNGTETKFCLEDALHYVALSLYNTLYYIISQLRHS